MPEFIFSKCQSHPPPHPPFLRACARVCGIFGGNSAKTVCLLRAVSPEKQILRGEGGLGWPFIRGAKWHKVGGTLF